MEFSHDYFENEVKEDFFVPSMIKRTWAAQLTVLDDVGRALKEHGMEYYAQWGTLLGAIRHRGYIPWDDDLDIGMKRADYNRFVENAADMLPEGYSVVSYKSSDNFRQMLCRIVNSDHYRFDDEFMTKFSGLPFAVGMDIFPLDFLTDDEEYEKERHHRTYLAQSLLDLIEKDGRAISDKEVQNGLKIVERFCDFHINKRADKNDIRRSLRELLEQIYGEVDEKDAKYITLYPIWFSNPDYKFPKEYFSQSVNVPFENITIPVPVGYEQVLLRNYGPSFMNPVRYGGAHNYPCYKNHIDVLREHFGYEWPRYEIDPDALLNSTAKSNAADSDADNADLSDPSVSFDSCVEQFLMALRQNHESLEYCQGLAIELGGLIESRFCEGTCSVGVLERYCEALYELSVTGQDNTAVLLDEFENTYREELSGRKLIVAVCCSRKDFENMIPVIEKYRNESDSGNGPGAEISRNVVKILPLQRIEIAPSMKSQKVVDEYEKNINFGKYFQSGFDGENNSEGECASGNVEIIREFDFAAKPDVIITDYGFDEYDLITSVPSDFYIKNLKRKCRHLVYVPPLYIKRADINDERLMINLEEIVRTPGVILSDEVVLGSEELKDAFIEILTGLCRKSEDMICEHFAGKISVIEGCRSVKCCDADGDTGAVSLCADDEKNKDGHEFKKILYYIGISEFATCGDKALEKFKSSMEVFELNKDKLKVIVVTEEGLEETLDEKIRKELTDIIAKAEFAEQIREADLSVVSQCCAYYGAPSNLANEFAVRNKPVMLRNIDILA